MIGLTIPPRMVQVNVRDIKTGVISIRDKVAIGIIPGFVSVGSGGLQIGLGLQEGFIHSMPVFILDRQGPDRSRVIVDAMPLPPELYWLRLVDGKAVKSSGRYSLTTICKFKNQSKANAKYSDIIALRKPEKGKEGCEHDTDKIRRAWGIVRENGSIEEVTAGDVVCLYEAPEICR